MTVQERKIRIALLQAKAQSERQLIQHHAHRAKASLHLPASVKPLFARRHGKSSIAQTVFRLIPVFALSKRYPYLTRSLFSLGRAARTPKGGTTWRVVAIGVLGWQLMRRFRSSQHAANITNQAHSTTHLPVESSADPS